MKPKECHCYNVKGKRITSGQIRKFKAEKVNTIIG